MEYTDSRVQRRTPTFYFAHFCIVKFLIGCFVTKKLIKITNRNPNYPLTVLANISQSTQKELTQRVPDVWREDKFLIWSEGVGVGVRRIKKWKGRKEQGWLSNSNANQWHKSFRPNAHLCRLFQESGIASESIITCRKRTNTAFLFGYLEVAPPLLGR